ncbi:DoxX family protein [Flavobacterium gawalongense]|uniref:DoxX family protein n=1 Tax=Flavobacterium gawalongense TaxID=2594432 RepID=A0A553BG49_9FLAO|nr:DoxX family protein [Flavobacterium gawalongense]TRW99918.1 DoxX family protein [Flavobacterium gawalongense]TRX04382.1 DoxX family protein [Flavobacterium gawalongense]TRX07230.1 DoxX family protein [Flavobacterium gawalongense]TRX07981.1 DoxX family protein [Flavobacterium gawalongense]TRX24232.1 DoxX family protein [Flavobacterium gawalongense]
MKTKNKKGAYLYWSLLILLAIFFAISGFMEITKNPSTYPKTLRMGYPPYFILTLGITKIAGVIALLIPNLKRLKEWAFAGFTFDVIFAFISGRAINSNADCIKSAIVFCILMLTYFLFLKKGSFQEVSTVTV